MAVMAHVVSINYYYQYVCIRVITRILPKKWASILLPHLAVCMQCAYLVHL